MYAPCSSMSNVTFIVMSGGLYQWQRKKHEENNQFSSPVIERACHRFSIIIHDDRACGNRHY
ncbi:hypothetical protein VCRA2117O328_320011 [Vibrio crassostreae]|nr:hypothetical protein VCRA2117O328_320011 [Vibrio crassostreae]